MPYTIRVLPRYPPCQTSPKPVAKKMVTQLMIAGFRLHDAPHMCDSGENDPKRSSLQLLDMLGFYHFDSHVGFPPQTSHFLEGCYRGIPRSWCSRDTFIVRSGTTVTTMRDVLIASPSSCSVVSHDAISTASVLLITPSFSLKHCSSLAPYWTTKMCLIHVRTIVRC